MEFLAPTTPSKKYSPQTKSLIAPLGTRYSTPDKAILSPSTSRSINSEPRSSSKSNTKSDRFIPNRNKMDFSYCNYNLLCDAGRAEDDDEEEGHKAQDPKSFSNKKMKAEVFQLANHTPGKRMLSCFDANATDELDSPIMKVRHSSLLHLSPPGNGSHGVSSVERINSTQIIQENYSDYPNSPLEDP
jgi:hypothetical protein